MRHDRAGTRARTTLTGREREFAARSRPRGREGRGGGWERNGFACLLALLTACGAGRTLS